MATKNCESCGSEFEQASNRQKFCAACGRRGSGDCRVCGKHFIRTGNTSGAYCSRACFHDAVAVPGRERRNCSVCGESFKPKRVGGETCSRECAAQAQRRGTWKCTVCQSDYSSKHYTKTCSRACAGILRRKTGESTCLRCGVTIPFQQGGRQKSYCSQACRGTKVGARRKNMGGYTEIKTEAGWRLEHRVVMEQSLGRALDANENVHHINGDRADNRIENLELWKKKQPQGIRSKDYHCAGCRCHEAS